MKITKRFIDKKELAADFEVCEATIDRRVALGLFPAPLRLGRKKVWLRTTIEEFIDEKVEEAKQQGATP